MKHYIISLFILTLSVPVFASEKQDYKCFVKSTDGDKVLFYRWKTKDVKFKSAALIASKRKDKKGKSFYIKSVQECVEINQDFKSAEAQATDKITLY